MKIDYDKKTDKLSITTLDNKANMLESRMVEEALDSNDVSTKIKALEYLTRKKQRESIRFGDGFYFLLRLASALYIGWFVWHVLNRSLDNCVYPSEPTQSQYCNLVRNAVYFFEGKPSNKNINPDVNPNIDQSN